MPRYRMTIAYDGTDFCGWQKQEPPASEHPDLPVIPSPEGDGSGRPRVSLRTVQQAVEQAVREVVREPVVVTGASRTDSGVHAWGQVAAFTSVPVEAAGVGWPVERGCEPLRRALNGRLPRDVLVRAVEVAPDDFDPIADALEKEYTYTIVGGRERPLWDRRFVFHTWHALDAAPMRAAAALLVGEHDFAAFAQINHGRKTTVRTITGCEIEVGPLSERSGSPHGQLGELSHLTIRVRGTGFLYNMVRILAGTLMEAGRGTLEPNRIPEILESKDRTANPGPTLPPQGLRLEWVRYEPATDS